MSIITKVLVILILVMSAIYLALAATLFSYRIDFKEQLKQVDQKLQKETEARGQEKKFLEGELQTKGFLIQKLETEIVALNVFVKTAQDDLIFAKTAYTELTNRFQKLTNNYEELTNDLEFQTKRNDELEQMVSESRDLKAAAEKDRDSYQARVLTAEDKLVKLEKSLSELEQSYVKKAKELYYAQELIAAYKAKGIVLDDIKKKVLVDGKVLSVSEKYNLMVISVGKNDKVAVGMEFTVYRGDKYVGKIRVEKVQKDWASAFSLEDFQADTIKVGDSVTTSAY